jgi:hypothetical protein
MKLSDLLTVCAAWPPSPPLPALPAEHEMGGGCLCHEHRHGDPAFVASQDAWFDSKPDEMDDEYIKWRDRPSTCVPCAPTTALSPKPAAAPEQPPPPPQQESIESKSSANQELQMSMPEDQVVPSVFMVV